MKTYISSIYIRKSSFSILTTFFYFWRYLMQEINDKKKQKLDRLYNKYKVHETFIIAKSARKTIRC